MSRKRGPEADKVWKHLDVEGGYGFDQTNGIAKPSDPTPTERGVTPEERAAAGAFISGAVAGPM